MAEDKYPKATLAISFFGGAAIIVAAIIAINNNGKYNKGYDKGKGRS